MFLRTATIKSTNAYCDNMEQLRQELHAADAVVIGAGSGLSTSAGFTYTGERFEKYFGDFIKKYGFHDMYSGGFYPFETLEEHWAYLEQIHLYQPLYGRSKSSLPESFDIGTEQRLFCIDNQCRPLFSESRI